MTNGEAARRGRNNQRRGRQAEWKVRDALHEKQWTVIRAAGSLGAADLVGLRGNYGKVDVAFVQVKTAAIGVAEWNDLFEHAVDVGGEPILATVLPRKPIQWERLLGYREPRSRARPSAPWRP